MNRNARVGIAQDSLELLEKGSYQNSRGENVSLKEAQDYALRNTKVYCPEEIQDLTQNQTIESRFPQTEFEVNDLTTLDSVRKEFRKESGLACLNFASARNPGGGFLNGSQAQEESIARASGLYPCLLKGESSYYAANRAASSCLYTDHVIYSPEVPIFRYEDGSLMDEIVFSSVITAPAVNAGVVRLKEPEREGEILPVFRHRMDGVLGVLYEQHCHTLILGAWGCGVFQNDPAEVAALFADLLKGKYAGAFRRVVFSVYSSQLKFIDPFLEQFS